VKTARGGWPCLRPFRMTTTQTTTRVLLATIAGAFAFLVAGVGVAAAVPLSSQQATSQCWKDVVNDWLKNQPNLRGTYAIPCYTQAIQHLSAYPDVAGYSSASDDIHRALLAAIHEDGIGGGGSPNIGPGGLGGQSGPTNPAGSTTHRSLWTSLVDRLSPGNAQSVPLPLIVLAGLALLLLLAAAATWFARRMQTRRVTPATVPAQRR
jgi:hypothetical protein